MSANNNNNNSNNNNNNEIVVLVLKIATGFEGHVFYYSIGRRQVPLVVRMRGRRSPER